MDPLDIWVKYRIYFCEDIKHRFAQDGPVNALPPNFVDPEYDYGLYLIGLGLIDLQTSLLDYGLPLNLFNWALYHTSTTRAHDPAFKTSLATTMREQLNADQLSCFETIIAAVDNDPQTAHFYLQGPGGTGKTFLYKTLCHYYRGLGKTVLCVASTGIAALLLLW